MNNDCCGTKTQDGANEVSKLMVVVKTMMIGVVLSAPSSSLQVPHLSFLVVLFAGSTIDQGVFLMNRFSLDVEMWGLVLSGMRKKHVDTTECYGCMVHMLQTH